MRIRVPSAELFRSATEVMRMLGTPYGHADDAVECYVWTQAVLQRGYDLVRSIDSLYRGPWAKPKLHFQGRVATVDLGGAPLLLYANRLADLAVVEAAGQETARVEGQGGFGGWVAPYVADRIARAGLLAIVRWSPPSRSDSMEAPDAVFGAVPEPSHQSGVVWVAPPAPFDAEPVQPASGAGGQTFPPNLGDLRQSKPGCLSIVASAAADCLNVPAALAHLAGSPRPGVLDCAKRLKEAEVSGVEAQADDHREVLKIAARIRVPSSERSREQAG